MGNTSFVPAQPFTVAAKAATPPEKEAGSAAGPVDFAVTEGVLQYNSVTVKYYFPGEVFGGRAE